MTHLVAIFATIIRNFLIYLCYCAFFAHIFVACKNKNDKENITNNQNELSVANNAGKKNNVAQNDNVKLVSEKSETNKTEKNTEKENKKSKETIENKTSKLSKTQELLAKFSKDKDTKIQYAPLDNQIISSDTLFKVKNNLYELNYATSCVNDSLIAQEMSDIQQRKLVIFSHNYQTDIAFKVNGQSTTKKTIKKDLFLNKIERDFLEKSIIKHPQFVRFDEAKNEAIFEFIIGVPNTDWLVIAAVNLSPQGNFRIIDIMMPEM